MQPETPKPLFSVVMPAFNADEYIEEAIQSVIQQDFDNWELLIVDDGSEDATYEVARRYACNDSRVRVFRQQNGGTASARNHAIREAIGCWALMLDADDLLASNCLTTYAQHVQAFSDCSFHSCNGRLVRSSTGGPPVFRGARFTQPWSVSAQELLLGNPIMLAGAVIGLDTLRAVGGFRVGVYNEDYDLWLRLALRGYGHVYHPDLLVLLRQSAGSKTRRYGEAARSSLEVVRSLPTTEISRLGLVGPWRDAVRTWESAVVIGDLQQLIGAREYAAARGLLVGGIRSVKMTPANLFRCLAGLLAPALYRRWLMRAL